MSENVPSETSLLKQAFISPYFWGLAAIFCGWAYAFGGLSAWPLAIFGVMLVALSVIDVRHMLLPDSLTISGTALGLALAPLFLENMIIDTLLGAILGFSLFALIHWAFFRVRGYHGLGFGDVKLMAMLGAWAGASQLPLILLVASFSALPAFAIHRLFFGGGARIPLPFGPFLALGGWVCVLYGGYLWEGVFVMRNAIVEMLI